jgi:hypothetical protein
VRSRRENWAADGVPIVRQRRGGLALADHYVQLARACFVGISKTAYAPATPHVRDLEASPEGTSTRPKAGPVDKEG